MNKCPRCGENNPAEVHTCTPGYHLSEHEKLKEIAYKIGYTIDRELIETDGATYSFEVNVREIIFTQEFMEKFISYCDINGIIAPSYYKIFLIDLHKNLNNPIDYLYKILGLNTK